MQRRLEVLLAFWSVDEIQRNLAHGIQKALRDLFRVLVEISVSWKRFETQLVRCRQLATMLRDQRRKDAADAVSHQLLSCRLSHPLIAEADWPVRHEFMRVMSAILPQ